MSNRLLNEVWDCAVPGLTSSERLVLLAVADEVRDNKDKTNRGECVLTDALLCRKTGLSTEALRKTKQRLAAHGLDVRVPVKDYGGTEQKDSKGRTVFAYEGRATRYALPVLTPSSGGNTVPPLTPANGPENTSVVGTQSVSGGNVVPQWREPVPTDSLKPPNNPMPVRSSIASLSPSVTRADREREALIIRAMQEHGATRDEIEATWEDAHDEGRGMKTLQAWVTKCSSDIAQRVADHRLEAEYEAYDVARRNIAAVPLPECGGCQRPMPRDTAPGTLCRDCR